ncbi:MAG: NUDIX domain-containing protein [Burkholderiaceae bacterium]|nr:NUDIX domain-containing protein [Burkholderiaceae bacterium]MDO9089376.1 NUDIX domain-containing protein [Burkholderiaceae bacterium]
MSAQVEGPDPAWHAALRAEADQAPRRPRWPLWAGEALIGSVEPDFLEAVQADCRLDARAVVQRTRRADAQGWQVLGEPTAALAQLALALCDAGLAHAWRDEQLAVTDARGRRIASIERAVVRPLGIPTRAVHLVGHDAQQRVWAQQRALNKPNDPGLWDTLMGGMIAAADTLGTALARETWEEAGLQLERLRQVEYGGCVRIRRPSDDGGGAGYVVEDIDWYRCVVPDDLTPDNQDGEVECFRLMDRTELLALLHRGAFTTEAALILCEDLFGR